MGLDMNDFRTEMDDILKNSNQQQKKIAPRDIALNAFSSVLIIIVLALGNGFVDGEFRYEQVFAWNMGILIVFNWIGGTALSYSMRQNGIKLAQITDNYIDADKDMRLEFAKISDYTAAQKTLDKKIDEDFVYRKYIIEGNIAKLVKHKMPEGTDWKQGKDLPPKTPAKVKLMARYLDKMMPPKISLIELSEKETSRMPKSIFDVPMDPTITGSQWFIRKGLGKVVIFSIGPIILSILAGALSGGAAFKSFLMIMGTLSIMLFMATVSFASAYNAVVQKGVDRLRRITRIIKLIL